jgi:hypothetical protein
MAVIKINRRRIHNAFFKLWHQNTKPEKVHQEDFLRGIDRKRDVTRNEKKIKRK